MTADKTLLRMKYADVVRALAERTGASMEEALGRFYTSWEYHLLSRGIADQHCMTPDYIVDDILRYEAAPRNPDQGRQDHRDDRVREGEKVEKTG